MNGNLTLDANIEMNSNGDWSIYAVHQDSVLSIILLHAFMEATQNTDFENIHSESGPMDEQNKPISYESMKACLLFAANFYAQRSLAFNENIKPELN